MLRIYILLITAIILVSCGSDPVAPEPSTTGVIQGEISDAGTNKAVGYARIITRPPTASVTSDTLGSYKIKNVVPGTFIVICYKTGFDSSNVSVTVSAGNTTIADLALNSDSTAVL